MKTTYLRNGDNRSKSKIKTKNKGEENSETKIRQGDTTLDNACIKATNSKVSKKKKISTNEKLRNALEELEDTKRELENARTLLSQQEKKIEEMHESVSDLNNEKNRRVSLHSLIRERMSISLNIIVFLKDCGKRFGVTNTDWFSPACFGSTMRYMFETLFNPDDVSIDDIKNKDLDIVLTKKGLNRENKTQIKLFVKTFCVILMSLYGKKRYMLDCGS